MGIIGLIIWVTGGINLLTKSPDPPSKGGLSNVRFRDQALNSVKGIV